jgi:hypothetical protein
MHISINHASQFRDAFFYAGRKDQFSYEGLGLLFEFLEELEPSYELDVIDLCCTYAESTPEQIADSYNIELDDVMEYLERHSTIVGTTAAGTIVYAQF